MWPRIPKICLVKHAKGQLTISTRYRSRSGHNYNIALIRSFIIDLTIYFIIDLTIYKGMNEEREDVTVRFWGVWGGYVKELLSELKIFSSCCIKILDWTQKVACTHMIRSLCMQTTKTWICVSCLHKPKLPPARKTYIHISYLSFLVNNLNF